jgi:hypothetical protein
MKIHKDIFDMVNGLSRLHLNILMVMYYDSEQYYDPLLMQNEIIYKNQYKKTTISLPKLRIVLDDLYDKALVDRINFGKNNIRYIFNKNFQLQNV